MRVLLRIAYDGTGYKGWQKQVSTHETVEEEVEGALASLFGTAVDLIGGSRTDAGVHSYGNPAVFDIKTQIPPDRIAPALNVRLPEDIRVLSSEEVGPSFHPHRVPSEKTYEYRIWNARFRPPTERFYTLHVHVPLDIHLMEEAGKALVGTHDFTSFSSVHAQVKSRVRTIDSLSVKKGPEAGRPPEEILIRVTGDGFLYHMVRIIAGTLIDVGRKAMAPDEVRRALEGKDRSLAGPTAPPEGLFLLGTQFKK